MKSKNHNFKEKPFQRVGRSYPEDLKGWIVLEINSGRISQRGAEADVKANQGASKSTI